MFCSIRRALSLIQQGWPDVMLPMFLEMLRRNGDAEEDPNVLFDDIMRLNGKQTIYQMIRFAERVGERGAPGIALVRRILAASRNGFVRASTASPPGRRRDDFLVFGARHLWRVCWNVD